MGIVLVALGMILLAVGVALLVSSSRQEKVIVMEPVKKSKPISSSDTSEEKWPMLVAESNQKSSSSDTQQESSSRDEDSHQEVKPQAKQNRHNISTESDSHAKGLEFEQYVVSKFSKKYWKIKDWRGDKKSGNRYAESSQYPDLEMRLTLHDSQYVVAVECKWRKEPKSNGKIEWSYPEQLKRYRRYAKETGIPVFIAIGLGGFPSKPDHVYIVPLSRMNSHEVTISSIDAYEHDISRNFFYDTDKGILN